MVIKTDVNQIRHGRLLSLKGKTALQLDEGKLWYSVDVPILLEYIDQLETDLKRKEKQLLTYMKK